MKGVSFSAIVNKITTTIDGGWRVTLDVPNTNTAQMGELSQLRTKVLQIGVVDLNDPENRQGSDGNISM